MDQQKTGKFIAALRKEREITQSELAEKLGVSDKTVSKWECGRGMPEISTIPMLCEILGISMNELLSGERLSESSYSEKAEENIAELMKDSKRFRRDISIAPIVFPVLLLTGFICFISLGKPQFIPFFVDLPSLLAIFAATTLILLAGRSYKALWRGIGYAIGLGAPDANSLKAALDAVRLAGRTMLISGIVVCVTGLIQLSMSENMDMIITESPFELFIGVSVCLVGVLYGLVGYLLSLPFIVRLKSRINKAI